ncbi:MAG: hypothetical protein AAB391_00375 [Patescibacteria group bacterium]
MNQNPCGHPVSATCERCTYDLATALAAGQNRQLTYEELNFVLVASLLRTDYVDARKVLDVFQRDFTASELEQMLATRVESGSYDLALHASHMAGRPLAQFEIDQVAIIGLRVHNNTHQVVQMAMQGLLSVAALKILVDIAVTKQLRQTAGFLRKKLDELEKLLAPATEAREGVTA